MALNIKCNLENDLERSTSCGYSLPQIVEIWLANQSDLASDPTVGTPTGGSGLEVQSITMKTTGEGASATTARWYKVEPAVNSASWSDNLGVGGNGNKYKIQSVGFSFSSAYDAGMVDTVDALALGKYIAVVKMVDGSYIMLGRVAGLEAQADGVNNSGTGDPTGEAGLVVTLTGNTVESALPLSEAAIKTVIGAE